jgi:hypothetical protein
MNINPDNFRNDLLGRNQQMYVFGSAILLIFILLAIASRREKLSNSDRGVLTLFVKMSSFLYRKASDGHRSIFRPLFRSVKVDKALKELTPDKPLADLRLEYYTGKMGLMLGLVFLGTGLAVGVKYQADQSRRLEQGNILYRSEYGDNPEIIRFRADTDTGFSEDVEVSIPVRRLTEAEANTLQAQYWNTLQDGILQQSTQKGDVTGDIVLETESSVYPFTVTWTSSHPDLLTHDGRIGIVTEPTDIELTAVLTYLPPLLADEEELIAADGSGREEISEKSEWSHVLTLHLNQPVRTWEETIRLKLTELLETAMESNRTQREWQLPTELEGQQIQWTEKPEDYSLWVLGMVLGTAALIYYFSDRDLQGKVTRRRASLQEAYPLIVNKLILYLGAGLTLRGAYQKIARQYREKKEQDHIYHPAYEEIVYTCHEIEAGVPESMAYENFGKRSGVSAYVKLNTLLIQNLKKGSRTLLERLRKEGELALSEGLQRKRKVGEEAGTKLLIPMIMMLGVVMVLVMIPAFSSFGT